MANIRSFLELQYNNKNAKKALGTAKTSDTPKTFNWGLNQRYLEINIHCVQIKSLGKENFSKNKRHIYERLLKYQKANHKARNKKYKSSNLTWNQNEITSICTTILLLLKDQNVFIIKSLI